MKKTYPFNRIASALLLTAALAALTRPLHADDAEEIRLLRAQIQALEHRLDQIEQKEAQQSRATAEATAAAQSAQTQLAQVRASAATTTAFPTTTVFLSVAPA